MNPWEGQGTVLDTGGNRSTPSDAPNRVNWGDVFNEAGDLLCAINPRLCPYNETYLPGSPPPAQKSNAIWWVVGGVGLILIILLIVLMARK